MSNIYQVLQNSVANISQQRCLLSVYYGVKNTVIKNALIAMHYNEAL